MSAEYDQTEMLTFEEYTAQLEDVLALLERGDLPLDHALATYERGVLLVRQANELLDKAELRVTELSSNTGRGGSTRFGIAEPLFSFDADDEE
jgi:exodeoxyribonuclease VII small subunit